MSVQMAPLRRPVKKYGDIVTRACFSGNRCIERFAAGTLSWPLPEGGGIISRMAEIQSTSVYFRFCPGEEQIKISNAICRGRRQSHYPKCHGCQFNDDEKGSPLPIPAQEKARNVALVESCFRSHDVLAMSPDPLSLDVAWRIGHAAGQFLHGRLRGLDRANPNVRSMIIGRDNRPNAQSLEQALIEGISSTGIDVVRIGVIDASQLYFAVNHFGACGGIHVTGGRHPAAFGGFRICGAKGFPIGSETGLASIRDIAVRVPRHQTGTKSVGSMLDLSGAYRDFIRRFLIGGHGLPRPLKVVVDACGGVAGDWIPRIFGDIDGLTIEPLNFEAGQSADTAPDPSAPANLSALRRATKQSKADFGIGFDGDAGRCLFVDEKGTAIGADLVAALLARRFIEREPGAAIVFDHRFSRVVAEEIERAGGHAIRERVGHVFTKKTMSERHAVFGADLSGRFYFRDHFFCESAFLAMVHVMNMLCESGRRMSELVRPVARYRSSGSIRLDCVDADRMFQEVAAQHGSAELEYLDGLTIRYADWWMNLRRPVVSKKLDVIVEARTKKLMDERLAELEPLLGIRSRQESNVS